MRGVTTGVMTGGGPGGKAAFRIAGRPVGAGAPVFIVAELSANHTGSLDVAKRTIDAMKEAGADAVKAQCYTPDSLTLDCDAEPFRVKGGTIWDGRTLYDLYREAYTPPEWQGPLKKAVEDAGLVFFSTPFDKGAVDLLDSIGVPAFKVASFEITDLPLIGRIASKGRPVIISTGIAELRDVEAAVSAARGAGARELALLKCTSSYPAPVQEMNLLTIPDMARRFDCVAGLSDHSMSLAVPVAAVALGAGMIEKHFILDRTLGGPDAPFSLEPREFGEMVKAVREAEAALGEASYELTEAARRHRHFARSLFVVADVKKGERFTEQNVRSIRPGSGLHPGRMEEILGRRAARDIKRGEPLALEMVERE